MSRSHAEYADGTGLIFEHGIARHPRTRRRYELRICPGCGLDRYISIHATYCSHRCSAWKGTQARYIASHVRVYNSRGKATSCVWECESNRFEWANLTGDLTNPDDYAAMCYSCHSRFDAARESLEPETKATGKHPVKLTADLVREIRRLRRAGEKNKDIAHRFGVDPSTISLIVTGRTWRWA